MKLDVKIIKASKDNIKDWIFLRTQLWPKTSRAKHLSEINDILKDKKNLALILFVNKKAVGFVECEIRYYAAGCLSKNVPYVEGWYINNKFRKFGLGKKIIRQLEKLLKVRGYKEIASDCKISNKISHKAHRALGFLETERLIHFKKKI